MNGRAKRWGAALGAITLTTLAASPAYAATISQAEAQAINLQVVGNSAVSQQVTATNDGSGEQKNDASTLPTIASVLPGTNILGAGVAPQEAGANSDGTSYACAGIAGTGAGIVKVGDSGCDIEGKPLDLDLANLQLGEVLLGNDSALGSALNGVPGIGDLLTALGTNLDGLVAQISGAVGSTPLGEIEIGGSLSAIAASCVATPDSASGKATLADTSGGSNATPITVTLPGVPEPLVVANLPANPEPNTHVLVNLDSVTQTLVDALTVQLDTMLGGALQGLGLPLLLQQVQEQVLTTLVAQLQPLLQPLQENVLDITLNKQEKGDDGRSITVTALDLQVLPAAQQFTGSSLISGEIGKVSCGPNARPAAADPAPQEDEEESAPAAGPKPQANAAVPTAVDAGADHNDGKGFMILGATGVLTLLAAMAGLSAYRRLLQQ